MGTCQDLNYVWNEKYNFLMEKKEDMENNGNLLGMNIVVIKNQKT